MPAYSSDEPYGRFFSTLRERDDLPAAGVRRRVRPLTGNPKLREAFWPGPAGGFLQEGHFGFYNAVTPYRIVDITALEEQL